MPATSSSPCRPRRSAIWSRTCSLACRSSRVPGSAPRDCRGVGRRGCSDSRRRMCGRRPLSDASALPSSSCRTSADVVRAVDMAS
eukprot:13318043-Alexandrium_andersonii.AAC.1